MAPAELGPGAVGTAPTETWRGLGCKALAVEPEGSEETIGVAVSSWTCEVAEPEARASLSRTMFRKRPGRRQLEAAAKGPPETELGATS